MGNVIYVFNTNSLWNIIGWLIQKEKEEPFVNIVEFLTNLVEITAKLWDIWLKQFLIYNIKKMQNRL